ncbi:hybrid sensor histidine kinase/response regulator [Fundidesulfovibrio terrae]|uniref:hybrid sensor histidine kinase/response regulator n=1 Tax=Fundidesulfovibrio terrae TaxID=2922866 RepID=UPI001FAFC249|nr:hybrid sensor histidine kinase/response regulator [Fundidesulfovibrio terrae]
MTPELADLSLLELFAMELQMHRQSIEDGLVALEADPSPERMEPLMRAAHSIKGAARIVNLPQAVELAHAMEDVFQAFQKGTLAPCPAHVDALLAANDFFGRLGAARPAEMPGLLEASASEAARLARNLRDAGEQQAGAEPCGTVTSGSADAADSAGPTSLSTETPGGTGTATPGAESIAYRPASPDQAGQPAPPGTEASAEPQDGVVRLSAALVGRLMGLAGQCVVEAGALGRIFTRMRGGRRDLMDLVDTLAELRSQAAGDETSVRAEAALALTAKIMESFGSTLASMDALTQRLESLSDRLYGQVLGSRMRPFGEGARPLPRLVRDLSRELGKKVRFTLDGSKAAVDRDILDKLEAPLMHLARNAVDHGIEPPAEREALGKSAQGRITLCARHVSGTLEVRLADDGRGVDPEVLREAVARKGLARKDVAARLSAPELFEFLFLPGFTTAQALTQVSGRGVGLDAVRSMVQEVGGTVMVESAPGKGTAFVMRLPVSRSVIRALVVQVGGEPYALPLSGIGRVVAAESQDLRTVEGRQFLTLDGAHVGLAPASQILGRPPAPVPGEELPVVVLESGAARFGLAVEAFLGETDLVVHPLDARLGKVPGVAAASILDDGSPVLILDVADLARALEALLDEGRLAGVGAGGAAVPAKRVKRILVVDDSLTVREVERQLLAGRGYLTDTAVDGSEGLALARTGGYDLVVTDVDMPRMTGIELTRRIKADPDLSRTPVMIVSYKDRQEDRLAGLEAGADYYLAKSGFHDEALLAAVSDLIGEP